MHELIHRQFLQRSLSASRRCSGSSATRLPKIGPVGFFQKSSRRVVPAALMIKFTQIHGHPSSSKLNSLSPAPIAPLNWLGPDAITAKWVALLRWVVSVRGATQEGDSGKS